jgi:hypothetical protein
MCFLPSDNHYFGLRSQPQQADCMCFHQQCVSERAFMNNVSGHAQQPCVIIFSKLRSWPALPHANVHLHKSQLMFKLLIKNIIYLYMMIELEHGKGSPLKTCLVCGNCWPKTKFCLSRKFCFYLIGGQKLACPQQILIHRATYSISFLIVNNRDFVEKIPSNNFFIWLSKYSILDFSLAKNKKQE